MKNIIALIPARMGSSRFPGKPMALINNKPMIGHVYERVSKSKNVALCAVATCDSEIFDYIESIGGTAVMTSNKHERASDRCAEALLKVEEYKKIKYDIAVMIQGDEPMTTSEMIDEALLPICKDENVQVVNLISQIESKEEFIDKNCIKVVFDNNLDALYFSRSPIPSLEINQNSKIYKQVCVIPFRRDFLINYTQMKPTPLEIAESVDMMRVLENGYKVRLVETKSKSYSVDTSMDLDRVSKIMTLS